MTLDKKQRLRLKAMVLLTEGSNAAEAARKIGITAREIVRSLRRYQETRSLDAFLDQKPSRCAPSFDQITAKRLGEILRTDARRMGFSHKEWSVGDVTLYLRRTDRIHIARDTVHDRMQAAGYRFDPARKRWELSAEPRGPSPKWVAPAWTGGVVELPAALRTQFMRVDVLPTYHELLVLGAMSSSASTTERHLAGRLDGHVSAVSLTLLLYSLEKKGCIARRWKERKGLLPQEWRLLAHGQTSLDLLCPWMGTLFDAEHPARRLSRADVVALFVLDAFPRGLIGRDVEAASNGTLRASMVSTICGRLERQNGLVERCASDNTPGVSGAHIYRVTPAGHDLVRIIRALCESQRCRLSAAQVRPLKQLRPPRTAKKAAIPRLGRGPGMASDSASMSSPCDVFPQESDMLFLCHLYRLGKSAKSEVELEESVRGLSVGRLSRRLGHLGRQGHIRLRADPEHPSRRETRMWMMSPLGREAFKLMQSARRVIFTQGYLPQRPQICILNAMAQAGRPVPGHEIMRATLGQLDHRSVHRQLRRMAPARYIRTQQALDDKTQRNYPHYSLTERGALAQTALANLYRLLRRFGKR